MDSKNVSLLLGAFIAILIGAVLIGTVASEGLKKTTTLRITSENISIADMRNVTACNSEGCDILMSYNVTVNVSEENALAWKRESCALSDISIVMQNISDANQLLTLGTDYIFTEEYGNFSLRNTTIVGQVKGNRTFVNYTYCPDEYVNVAWGRTIINLVPGFFALAILGIGISLLLIVLKREGIGW